MIRACGHIENFVISFWYESFTTA